MDTYILLSTFGMRSIIKKNMLSVLSFFPLSLQFVIIFFLSSCPPLYIESLLKKLKVNLHFLTELVYHCPLLQSHLI